MGKFIYQNIINEFEEYLDDNLEESIYFESLRIKFLHADDASLVYRSIIKENRFKTTRVLNKINNINFSSEIRKQRKIRKYEDYTANTLDSLKTNSILKNRLNSIQAINTISTLKKKTLFSEIHNNINNYPTSVKVSLANLDFQFNNDPYESLSEMMELISNEARNENLYYNYLKYYLSNENINDRLRNISKNSDKKEFAFMTALLYVFSKYDNSYNELFSLIEKNNSIIKKITNNLPSGLNKKHNLMNKILENLSEKDKKTLANKELR